MLGVGAWFALGLIGFVLEGFYKDTIQRIPFLGKVVGFLSDAFAILVLFPLGLLVFLSFPGMAISALITGEEIFLGILGLFISVMCANPAYHFVRKQIVTYFDRRRRSKSG